MGAPQYEQAGADIGGTGTTNTIPRWTGPSTLGDSAMVQSAAAITVSLPQFALGVTGSGTGGGYRVVDDTGTSRFLMGFVGVAGAKDWSLYDLANSAYRVVVVGTGAGAGNVGIGTASPGYRLHVEDTNLTPGYFKRNATSSTGPAIILDGAGGFSNNYAGLQFRSNNVPIAQIIQETSGNVYFDYNINSASGALVIRSGAGTERARIDSAGNFILNSANTGATIQAAGTGQGLKLPATPGNTDPNTLDCYADGGTANSGGVTWTPTISFGGASTGITYQAGGQVGRYTRIGNMVYATCYIVLTNKGSAAGAVRINGLPTSANTAGLFISAHIGYFANITSTGQVMGYMASNDTGFVLNQTTAAGANTALTDANFANNSAIIATIAYPVT